MFGNIYNNKQQLTDYFINRDLKQSTIDTYFKALKRVISLLDDNFDNFNNVNLTHEQIKEAINKIDCNNSRKNTLNCIIKILLAYGDLNQNIIIIQITNKLLLDYNKFSRIVDNQRIYKQASDKELNNISQINKPYHEYLTDYLNEFKDKFKSNIFNKSNDVKYMLIRLYLFLPLRQQDYCNTNIYLINYNINNNSNYILLDEKKLYINKYKTANIYGQRIIDLDDDLVNDITHFYNKSNQNKLLPSIIGDNNMLSNNCTKLLTSITNLNSPVQTLRKLYISEFYKKCNSGKEFKLLAKKLGHSPSIAIQQYNRFSDIADDEEQDLFIN